MSNDNTVSRRERFARLNHSCIAAEIWMNDPENTMNLEELKALSTKELTELYNKHAEKQVKRMESRAKLEERTAQLLRDQGKLDEGGEGEVSSPTPAPAKGKGKRGTNNKPPIEAPITEEGTADMATATKTKKTAAKKNGKAAPTAKKEPGKRGAPLTDHTYKAISEKSKNYNPNGNKLQASSARGVVYEVIKKKADGISRSKLEEMFPDQNVKSALDVLVKFGFIQTA